MKLSKSNPITRLTRKMLDQKWLMKRVPIMLRYGGWLFMMVYRLFGMKVLLLTTSGRKSGEPRTTPAMYVDQDAVYYIAAISTARQKYPNWYYNLMADSNVMVEIFWKRRSCLSELVDDLDERIQLLGQFPFGLVEAAQDHAPEDIPVFRLVPDQE
jgi:deazaflavin-dependent oxidoreductase (nitroreductase family)